MTACKNKLEAYGFKIVLAREQSGYYPAMIIFIAYSAALIRARRPLLAFTSTLGLLELTAQKFMLLPQMAPTTRRSLLSLPTRS